jgi:hypothetical protein
VSVTAREELTRLLDREPAQVGIESPFRVLKRLFLPVPLNEYYLARLSAKADLPWQPYLHNAIFWGVILTLLFGEREVIPPVKGIDWIWVIAGLASPIIGFVSLVFLENGTGETRYRAFWLRLAADVGLATAILAYGVDSGIAHQHDRASDIMYLGDAVLFSALMFLFVLIYRDIKFLALAERVATELHNNNRHEGEYPPGRVK